MSDPEVEYEFTAEGVIEGFGGDPFFSGLLAEAEVTPEEFAAYLNEAFDQSARQNLAAMAEDHEVELEIGGKARVREWNSFEEWKQQTGYEGERGDAD